MSSDSEVSGPSPLPSPIFARCSPVRSTVARKCREYFLKRLERTASMQKRWSICDVPSEYNQTQERGLCNVPSEINQTQERGLCDVSTDFTQNQENRLCDVPSEGIQTQERGLCDVPSDFQGDQGTENVPVQDTFEGYPLRKCRSSFDIAMDSLRREISSLIAQDNALFRQLLSLHDSIAELRERQHHSATLDDDDEEEDDRRHKSSRSPSLESLADTSPESTLSSRSSLSGHHKPSRLARHRRHHHAKSRPLVFIDKSEICFRCKKMAPPYRRSSSITSLYYLHEDMESYDSGIHLQGSHSDSDHEIFV